MLPPTLRHLSLLVKAHLSAIPFENISKLHYLSTIGLSQIPPFELYLEGIENHHFGGTCYSNNYYFYQLLVYLGYQVKLCAADMKSPGSHMVMMVTLDHHDYLVDVGYAAPFIEPIPLHMTKDYQLLFGRDRFVVRPGDSLGSYQLLLYRNGTFKHGYTVRPVARKFEDFNEAILNSFKPDSTFFNSLLLTKYTRNSFWILHNLELVESTPRSHAIKNISGLDELESVIHEKFGISPSISRRIITRLDLSADAWN